MITKAKKRLLTFTMVLMVYVVAVLSPVSVSQTRVMAAECEGDYEYIYLPDNSVEITSYNAKAKSCPLLSMSLRPMAKSLR